VDKKNFKEDAALWPILEERARALALQKLASDEDLSEEVLIFQLGEGKYSLPAHFVSEVQPLRVYTALPTTPLFIVGLVNVRGRILTAIDIRPLLDIPPTPPKEQGFLLIINAAGMEVGLLADLVTEVRRGEPNLAPALSTTSGRGMPWIRGIDRDLNLLLDPPLLLADPRMVINRMED